MDADESDADASSTARYRSLDVFRGVAVLLMFEAHVVNTTLRPELQQGLLWRGVDFVNGLVAPVFLLTAGLVFALATPASRTSSSAASVIQTWGRQILLIWGIGYLLRAPGLSPSVWRNVSAETWAQFLHVDILHCIALGWVIVIAAYLAIPSVDRRQRVLAGLSVTIVAATPILWSTPVHGMLPTALANYLSPEQGSLFPFFPWGAYVLSGAVAGRALRSADRQGTAHKRMRRLLVVGGIGGVSIGIPMFTGHRIWENLQWDGDPLVVLTCTLLALALMAAFYLTIEPKTSESGDAWSETNRPGRMLRWFGRIGQASLLLYVAHLLVLYRAAWGGHTLASMWGDAMSGWGTAILFLALAAAMTGVAWIWRRAKQHHTWRVAAQVFGLLLVIFCLA
jgi:uncharacterized membrane protein